MPKRKVMRKRTDCSKCKLGSICGKNKHNRKGHCQHFVQCTALGQFIKNIFSDACRIINDAPTVIEAEE